MTSGIQISTNHQYRGEKKMETDLSLIIAYGLTITAIAIPISIIAILKTLNFKS